jgi:hypothetical protein
LYQIQFLLYYSTPFVQENRKVVRKPTAITRIGVVQTILASTFVVWLLFFPSTATNFAWPIVPEVSAMFIGAGFIARAFLGVHLWRQQYWYRLRWQVWGNYAFLAVILVATFWHVGEMNWSSNIWVAHIWVLAYTIEPLVLPLYEPRGEEVKAPIPDELKQGPIFVGLKRVLLVGFVVGVTLGLLLFINPEFMDTRWPWPLDPFDARIMAAFPILVGLWALYGYQATDWADIKPGILGSLMFTTAVFGVWAYNLPNFDPNRENVIQFGVITAVFALLLGYYFFRQERAKVVQTAPAGTAPTD